MRLLKYVTALFLLSYGTVGQAQMTATFKTDHDKVNQLKSMEFEKWDFSPGMYYFLLHNDGYSGAKLVWQWAGLKSRLVPKFYEERSKVKRVMYKRTAAAAEEIFFKSNSQNELDSITPIFNEETARSIDRNVDIAYDSFKSDFHELQSAISRNLNFCLDRSKGKLTPIIEKYVLANDVLCERVQYIHKTGPGYELENTKREIAYEEARQEMKKLEAATRQLMRYAAVNYPKE